MSNNYYEERNKAIMNVIEAIKYPVEKRMDEVEVSLKTLREDVNAAQTSLSALDRKCAHTFEQVENNVITISDKIVTDINTRMNSFEDEINGDFVDAMKLCTEMAAELADLIKDNAYMKKRMAQLETFTSEQKLENSLLEKRICFLEEERSQWLDKRYDVFNYDAEPQNGSRKRKLRSSEPLM